MQLQQSFISKPPYQIYITKHFFYLSCILQHLSKPQFLKIQRQTCKVDTIDDKQFYQSIKQLKPLQAMLIIGILILSNQIYLLYVSSATVAYPYPKSDQIYQAQNIIHLPFRSNMEYKYSRSKKNNQQILKYLQQTIFKKNYYFRYRSDITLSMENIKLHNKSTQPKFFWNHHLVRIFKQNNSHKCWRIPLMQGFIKYQSFANDCYYLMIARRSKILSGPKLMNRGIWQGDGQSVANFVQVEQIYKIKYDTFSYVSLRGSVPVYWKQNKGSMQFKNDDKNPIGFNLHLQSLQRAYPQKRIYYISWLMRQKQQLYLKQKLDVCFYHSKQKYHQNDNYRLISIDIDQNNKNATYYLKQLIHNQVSLLMPYKDNFFWITQQKGKQFIMGKQKLIYRVNCVDCTQRTNAVMIQLSRKTMRDVQDMLSIKYNKNQVFQKLQDVVVNKWKQLGNRICRLYLGQQQLQIGKKQQAGFFSMFNLYKDPIGSQFKQRSLQLFLNQITPKQVMWIQKNLQRKLNITEHCIINSIKLFIISWNCNNLNPLSINQLSKQLLLKFNRGKVDVVVFNLQQMVQLSAYNMVTNVDKQLTNKWKQLVADTLNQKINTPQEKFDFLIEENLVAVHTWVFIKNKIKIKHFQGKQSTNVKTGFVNGTIGNKGAVIILLKFDSTWISLVNCHLTAGQGKKSQRKQSLELILYGWIQQKFRDKIQDSDVTFLIGDLNFRLDWTQQEIKGILYEVKKKFNKESLKMGMNINSQNQTIINNLKTLWQKDQLLSYQKDPNDFIHNFKQKPLAFMPTYKFIKKTHIDQYDQKRSPAWCDRILYDQKIHGMINQIIYQDIDINLSDHKPVCALFEVKIKKIQNKDEYLKMFQEEKKIYYGQKDRVLKYRDGINIKVDKSQMIESGGLNNSNLYKKAQNLDFFCQKQVQANKEQILIDVDFSSQRKSNNLVLGVNPSKQISQNLLDIPSEIVQQRQRRSQKSPSKNDFLQFEQILQQIQRTNVKKDQNKKNQNLLDLA